MSFNIVAFIEYINREKKYHIDASYYSNIEQWRKWWEGYVPKVHDVIEGNGSDRPLKRRMASLRIAKKGCEDWANLLLNDRTTLQIGDKKTETYLLGDDEQQTGGLLRELNFWPNANKLVEQAFWSGTGAFVLGLENFKMDGTGAILPSQNADAKIVLDYDPASGILPIRVERGIVKDVAFASELYIDGKPCVYLQTYTETPNGIEIHNEFFQTTDGSSGTPTFTPRERPPGMVEKLTIRKDSPRWFSIFSPAAAKNIDGGAGLGMSVFSEALDEMQAVDYAFDNYRQDIILGGKKIFYDRDICEKYVDKDGKERTLTPDQTRRQQFYSLPKKEGSLDAASEWHEYNPDLRVEANHQAVQDALDYFSFKIGLGCKYYRFDYGNVSTATEYVGSRQDLIASANKNQIQIEAALVGIVRAILWTAKNMLGKDVDPDTSISINWDDSYITDAETRMAQMRADALSGLIPKYKYLSSRYGISEEEARKWAQEAQADAQPQETLKFGGDA